MEVESSSPVDNIFEYNNEKNKKSGQMGGLSGPAGPSKGKW